jgi:hypothetical protein
MYQNILQSGSKYLLTTTFPGVQKNGDLHYEKDKVSGRRYILTVLIYTKNAVLYS